MVRIRWDIQKVFILIFSIIGLVDTLNGYLMNFTNIGSVVGPIYRLMIIVVMLFMIIYKNNINKNLLLVSIFIYFLFITVFFAIYNTSSFSFNLGLVLKLLFPILIIEAYRNIERHNKINKQAIEKILEYNAIVFPLTLAFSALIGVGRNTYHGGIGFRGLYNSNNELNIVLVVLFVFVFDKMVRNKENKLKYILLSIINFCALLSVASKTSMFAIILTVGVYFILQIKDRRISFTVLKKWKLSKWNTAVIGVLSIVSIYILKGYFTDIILGMFSRQKYLMKIAGENNLIGYVLSNRDVYFKAAVQNFTASSNKISLILFGAGPYEFMKNLGNTLELPRLKEVEMDFFDTFFYYGIIGITLVYSYYFRIFKDAFQRFIKLDLRFSYLWAFILMTIFSTFAGHVLYVGMSSMFLALLSCAIIRKGTN